MFSMLEILEISLSFIVSLVLIIYIYGLTATIGLRDESANLLRGKVSALTHEFTESTKGLKKVRFDFPAREIGVKRATVYVQVALRRNLLSLIFKRFRGEDTVTFEGEIIRKPVFILEILNKESKEGRKHLKVLSRLKKKDYIEVSKSLVLGYYGEKAEEFIKNKFFQEKLRESREYIRRVSLSSETPNIIITFSFEEKKVEVLNKFFELAEITARVASII